MSIEIFKDLLSPEDPAPVTITNPDGASNIVFVCDHASNTIPHALGDLGLSRARLDSHIAWDIGALDIAKALSKVFDAPLVSSGFSRLVYDLNRYTWDPFAMTAQADTHDIPGNMNLSAPARERRWQEIANPYYCAVNSTLERACAKGKTPIMVSVHTMTDKMKQGKKREEAFAVLANPEDTLSRRFLQNLRNETTLTVGDNTPYALDIGIDYTVPECAHRRGFEAIMFELRQDLTLDATILNARINELAKALENTLNLVPA